MLVDHVKRVYDGRFPRRWEAQAVEMAMQSRWDDAATLNNQILAAAPDDLGALNRLGRALIELGRYDDARLAYNRTLAISPSNPIAQRNITRLDTLQGSDALPAATAPAGLHMFIAEPGKAAVTTIKLSAKAAALAKMAVGEQVELVVSTRSLKVRDLRGAPLGTVEPRLAHRIIDLTNGGNRYDAALLSMSEGEARVVIRETYQDPTQIGKVAFLAQDIASYTDLKDAAQDDDEDEVLADVEGVEDDGDSNPGFEEVGASGGSVDDTYSRVI